MKRRSVADVIDEKRESGVADVDQIAMRSSPLIKLVLIVIAAGDVDDGCGEKLKNEQSVITGTVLLILLRHKSLRFIRLLLQLKSEFRSK